MDINQKQSKNLKQEIAKTIETSLSQPEVRKVFWKRFKQGDFTRDENQHSHFCVFFAGYDAKSRKVFMGHHIKADRWIFNGGHIDRDELMEQTIKREMQEEWGAGIGPYVLTGPSLITLTLIDNESNCKKHFDIWYFLDLDEKQFKPDPNLLKKEFYDWRWLDLPAAREIIDQDDRVMQQALDLIEDELLEK